LPVAYGSILAALDYAGTAVFAASGALSATRKEMDPVGAVFLATATGMGGGTLRDLLLGAAPVFWVRSPTYLVVCVAAALLVFAGSRVVALSARPLVWADSVGLATFAVIGTEAARSVGAAMPIALLMGVTTATGGGSCATSYARSGP
jgi:uncharacterized membrane protein YeiH